MQVLSNFSVSIHFVLFFWKIFLLMIKHVQFQMKIRYPHFHYFITKIVLYPSYKTVKLIQNMFFSLFFGTKKISSQGLNLEHFSID